MKTVHDNNFSIWSHTDALNIKNIIRLVKYETIENGNGHKEPSVFFNLIFVGGGLAVSEFICLSVCLSVCLSIYLSIYT